MTTYLFVLHSRKKQGWLNCISYACLCIGFRLEEVKQPPRVTLPLTSLLMLSHLHSETHLGKCMAWYVKFCQALSNRQSMVMLYC